MSDEEFEELSGEDMDIDDDFDDLSTSRDDLTSSMGMDMVDGTKSSKKNYEALEESQVVALHEAMAGEIAQYLDLPPSMTALLLLGYPTKEAATTACADGRDAVMARLGLSEILEVPPPNPASDFHCPICLEVWKEKETFALACGHRFCSDCWGAALSCELSGDPSAVIKKKCLAKQCPLSVHDMAWRRLLPSNLLPKYLRFLSAGYVAKSPTAMKFCPSPGCNYIVHLTYAVKGNLNSFPVTCGCGFAWCFNCAAADIGDHSPATCKQVESWRERETGESETLKWLAANTKQCPNCKKPIEKNEGCMHMTCRSNAGGCGHEFCWLCRGDWKQHGSATGGYFACNKYQESDAAKMDQEAEVVKADLKRYLHYFHRYQAHHNAAKVADEQRKKAEEKGILWVEKRKVLLNDVTFLVKATDQLARNRKVLRWSYVYAFYAEGNAKVFFEFVQADLERYTDELSKAYETRMDEISDFHQWRSKVLHLIGLNDKFFEKFVEGVRSGDFGKS